MNYRASGNHLEYLCLTELKNACFIGDLIRIKMINLADMPAPYKVKIPRKLANIFDSLGIVCPQNQLGGAKDLA